MPVRPSMRDGEGLMGDLAVHGIAYRIPGEWDVAVNRGDWNGGMLVLVDRRTPLLNVTWNRRQRRPDFPRTIRGISKRMARDAQATCEGTEAVAPDGLLARYSCPQGGFCAAAFRPDPDEPVTVIMRQLSPGSSESLRELIRATRVYHADEILPWRLHDLHIDLDARWRLQGVQQYTGMARAVWMRSTGKPNKHDQVLVLRRYACPERMLAGADIATWVGDRLRRREVLREHRVDEDGVWRGICSVPADTWLKRLRGLTSTRHLDAWIEAGSERLMIQEWKGAGDPFPPAIAHHPPMPHPLIGGAV